ncbi:MAG: hypothetical protein ACYTG0_27650 [Planctomycetota bacterium]|jgi:hypothetical protein
MKGMVLLAGVAAWVTAGPDGRAGQLEGPIAVVADGKPIDTEHAGNAAPFVADFDGDGRRDLLVGEMYLGRLRIYRNVGTDGEPRFEKFSVFQEGVPEGRVPAG